MNYEIYNVSNPITEQEFKNIYTLLANSLPQNEMRSFDGQKKLLNDSHYNLLVAFKDNNLIAFMAIWDLGKYSFIEHFAVDASLRGTGIGGKLLDKCKAYFKNPIILEVEPPKSTKDAARRIEFYKRHGFLFNDYPYEQPPLQPEFVPLPLKIMSYPNALDNNDFNEAKNTLYTNIYGVL